MALQSSFSDFQITRIFNNTMLRGLSVAFGFDLNFLLRKVNKGKEGQINSKYIEFGAPDCN